MQFPDKSEIETPKPEIQPVASGIKLSKRSASSRFKSFLFAESPKDLMKKVAEDVVVPRLKMAFEEALGSFISGALWSGNRPTGGGLSVPRGGTVIRQGTNYAAISQMSGLGQAREAIGRTAAEYQDLECPTRDSAEMILANLFELLNSYRRVAVGDLYDLAGISSPEWANSYGWHSLDGARIDPSRGVFVLRLPRPVLIK